MSVSRKGAKFGPKIIKKMDGNDRFPIDFPCVSIKGSQLPVYTKFLHSIDISICSCYGLNAIFNCGSRLSCMVQWLPVNILNCQPHKKNILRILSNDDCSSSFCCSILLFFMMNDKKHCQVNVRSQKILFQVYKTCIADETFLTSSII